MHFLVLLFAVLSSIILRYKILSRTINSITVNSLSFETLRQLMNNQPAEHLEEVPFGDFDLELNLCDDIYVSAEQAGLCKSYVVFVDGEYAGYMVVMAAEMIHHRDTMQAVTDSFYIAPAYRSVGAFSALLHAVEDDLKANNIRFFTIGMNPNMPDYEGMKNYIERQYKHTEYLVTKEL